MNVRYGLTLAFVLGLLSAIGFGLVALFISEHKIAQFDNTVTSYIQGFESPWLTVIMKFFTYIGSTPAVIVLSILVMILLYKILHHRMELIFFGIVLAGAGIMNQILKHIFARTRPDLHRLITAGGYSFPSGHSMAAFAMYGVLSFLLWRHIRTRLGRSLWLLLSTLMILAIGISRVYLGVHYPSDILGGYLASGWWLAFAIWFYQRYQEKKSR
ncbi:phosphatidylglycerophosphatase B [Collibacillus ludicampi]|uniref:Phosphatidylglycerophosphatase B n=1 Tax=Collibacillus ludicampi TaxID=2771369 RepID=A0AAV4LFJ9_9BACL|nr:phosphatase PAP2 family protein [Collibacillus ludicampi]GIM46488.1 phosphatidylglycerophosphatase B [Collibacillus ludicampi]